MKWVEYDVVTGRIYGTGSGGSELPPGGNGRAFVEVQSLEDIPRAGTYDAASNTFTADAVSVTKRLSKADVIGQLTPAQWAEMNRFHPTGLGVSPSGVAYNDPDVFWAMSVFNAAGREFSLDDPRLQQIIDLLVSRGVLTASAVAELQAKLAAVAR